MNYLKAQFNKVLISIIIPIYNVEDFLDQCIESVVGQTYSNLEIILVNDGSTDSSPEICKRYCSVDKRVIYIEKENGGLSDARNAGLSNCSGEYIYFLDSDDYLELNTIEYLLFEADLADADLVFFDAQVEKEIEEDFYRPDTYIRKGFYSQPSPGVVVLEKLFKNNEYASSVPLLFIKKDLIVDNRLKFEKGIIYEDILFTFQIFLLASRATHLPEALYHRRVRKESIMTAKVGPRNFFSLLKILSIVKLIRKEKFYDSIYDNVYTYQHDVLIEVICKQYWELSIFNRIFAAKHIFLLLKTERSIMLLKLFRSLLYYTFQKLIPRGMAFKIKTHRNLINGRKKFRDYADASKYKKVYLLGTPLHGNLGDHVIALGARKLLSSVFPDCILVEIPMNTLMYFFQTFSKEVKKEDVLCISGGGWLGTLWFHNELIVRKIINSFPANKTVILPQTVFFNTTTEMGKRQLLESRQIYSKHKELYFFVREKKSYEFVINHGLVENRDRCILAPDLGLNFASMVEEFEREGVLLCFRQDRESLIEGEERNSIKQFLVNSGCEIKYTTTVLMSEIHPDQRLEMVEQKIREFKQAKLIITDRLHCMILSAISGTPCIAFDNRTKKVSGVYDWIRNLSYIAVVDNVSEMELAFNTQCWGTVSEFPASVFEKKLFQVFKSLKN